ncbi:MAG: IclR family transcriptional regulator [Candidatus Nanopelagicales bacterium]
MAESRAGAPTGAQAIERASALLVSVLEAERPPLLTQLASAHGLAKSTVSRMLSALERLGRVARDREGAFIPGQTLVRFARTRAGDIDLISQYRPLLERLATVTGETANLAVAIGDAVESLDQADGAYLLGTRNWVGSRLPLHCSALGKVLLAFDATPIPPGRLERRTPHTISTRAELVTELALVRRRGFAVIKDELEEGLTAVAAPIRDDQGKVIASVSVTGPSSRLTQARLPALGLLLIDETRRFPMNQRRRKDAQS